jgi:hypothetical protein
MEAPEVIVPAPRRPLELYGGKMADKSFSKLTGPDSPDLTNMQRIERQEVTTDIEKEKEKSHEENPDIERETGTQGKFTEA